MTTSDHRKIDRTPLSASSKAIARAAATAFGGKPQAQRYWDDRKESSVDLVSCAGSPWEGVTSYATVGVSRVYLMKDGKELDVRTELVGACRSESDKFGNCLATAAFFVINSGWFVAPGIIFPDILSIYSPSITMRHFLFLPPFLWEGKLRPVEIENRTIAWLLAVPISQRELQIAETRGVPALEDLFEEGQIDIFDLGRPEVA